MSLVLPVEFPSEGAKPAQALTDERCQGLKGCSNEASCAYYRDDGRARHLCSQCEAAFVSY